MHKLNRNILKMYCIAVVTLLMSNCTPKVTSVTTISGCHAFSPIYPSRADTEQTKRQVLVHNLTYEEVCKEQSK